MINMPISDYPVSADPRCSAAALGEKKSELEAERARISDSSLPPEQKEAANSRIDNQKKDIDAQIRKKETEINYRKKLDNKRLADKSINKKELNEQFQNTKTALDKRI